MFDLLVPWLYLNTDSNVHSLLAPVFDLHVFSTCIVLLEQLDQNTQMEWTEFETCKHMRIYAHTQKGCEQQIAFANTPHCLQ